ncbi:MAG: methyltransferase [Agarilytica sp.]
MSDKLQREAFGLTILKNSHPDIRKIRKETGHPSIHGNKFWKSTFLLMDYLNEYPPKKGAKILEIGCGWGLGGIYCAKAFKARVVSLDADDTVFPYLEHHAKINKVESNTWKCRYEKVRKEDLKDFDLMIGADICFWDEMVKPLYNLTKRAREAGVRVVMTDPGRPTFRELAEKSADKMGAVYDNWSTPHPYNFSGLVLDVEPK